MECAICFQEFNRQECVPYVLPDCGHTLCGQCIPRLLEGKCPTCRCGIRPEEPPEINTAVLSAIDNENPPYCIACFELFKDEPTRIPRLLPGNKRL
ncbi:hypothetical protein B9Z55_000720 [Caenorhabditis nigoni]|uniref:RING-type domain-containing protein n=1 Tax=Caenorhabditis nigoni TaxID=1611254 RepID=A0A2G5VUJ1_9PELO|nr:hypothetical protein B9Z55_000720 [Caenorhabditis nigoni]